MPPARLPERPKPPTGQQMLADIAGADDNDVVFLTGQVVDLSDLTPTTPEGGEGGDKALTQASLSEAERRESAQRAYHRALELLEKVRFLEESPGQLQFGFNHLNDLGAQVSGIIQELQEASSHLNPQNTGAKDSKIAKDSKSSKDSKSPKDSRDSKESKPKKKKR